MESFFEFGTKPKNGISENSVKPQENEGKSPKASPTAWTDVPNQLNPDRDKIFNLSTKILGQKFGVDLASAPRFLFEEPTNQVVQPIAGPYTLSQLNPDRDKMFGFSGSKNFQGAFGATTSAARKFKLDAALSNSPGIFYCPISSVFKECVRCYFEPGLAQASSHEILFH